jgi:hypothetical protein
MNEIWKPVVNYVGYYEVSNLGNVHSIDRTIFDKNGVMYIRKGKTLKPSLNKSGYLQVALSIDNKLNSHTVHTLVANAFIENIDNKPTVNHIDGNKQNNNVLNLEWATKSEQAIHSLNHNLRKIPNSWIGKFGSKHGASKKVSQYTKDNVHITDHDSIIEAANKYNIHPSLIIGVCKGRKKTSCGYIWKYL